MFRLIKNMKCDLAKDLLFLHLQQVNNNGILNFIDLFSIVYEY